MNFYVTSILKNAANLSILLLAEIILEPNTMKNFVTSVMSANLLKALHVSYLEIRLFRKMGSLLINASYCAYKTSTVNL